MYLEDGRLVDAQQQRGYSLQNKLTTLTTTNLKWGGTKVKLISWVGTKTAQLRIKVGTYVYKSMCQYR